MKTFPNDPQMQCLLKSIPDLLLEVGEVSLDWDMVYPGLQDGEVPHAIGHASRGHLAHRMIYAIIISKPGLEYARVLQEHKASISCIS